jgi:hypothetical protein
MTSSVTPIEISAVSEVHTDDASLIVTLADGRVISTPLDWFPRLAHGTPGERANWRPIGDGEGVHWPDLDEHISVEGLIAGRKSGEGAASLKRWMNNQAQLRQMPTGYRELRREVVNAGPLSSDQIEQRIGQNVLGFDGDAAEWTVAVAADPFMVLTDRGMTERLAIAAFVFQAVTSEAAKEAKQACVRRGMTECANDERHDAVYVAVFSQKLGANWASSDD